MSAPSSPAASAPAFAAGERRAFLKGRIETLRDEHPDALATLATSWPLGVPTFKSDHEHTADELEAIALAISAVEAKHSVPFLTGDEVDPTERRAPQEVVDSFIGRMEKLPADIAADLAAALAGKVPNLRRGTFTVTHAAILEPALTNAENEAARRFAAADALLKDLTDGDTQLLDPVLASCGTDRYTWTRLQLETLTVLHAAVGSHVAYGADSDDAVVLTVLGGEKDLIARFGSRKDAVTACKQIAETFGLATPRLLSDVVATPALYAHAMSASTQATATQGAAA